jgi:hypothetical protein
LYSNEEFSVVLEKIDLLISQLSGEEIVSKFELLKANTIGKQKDYWPIKMPLQFVADNYSNTEEGKSARNTNRPNSVTRKKWSLVMRIVKVIKFCIKSVPVKMWHKKLLKKTKEIFSSQNLSVTYDNYTSNEVL